MKEILNPNTSMAPVPVVMVSCGNEEKSNIITIAWTGIASSEPPTVYVSIRKNRYSYNIIKETGEFAVNIPNKNLVWQVDFCGTKTGKDIDKFKEAGLTKEKSNEIRRPLIKECPINLECRVKEIRDLGSHDMFIGEVVSVHCDDNYINILNKGNKLIDFSNVETLLYAGDKYMVADKIVAKRGISLK